MMMPARSPARAVDRTVDEIPARERILEAAFSAFTEGGYPDASTLEIATRARVSKRALYALVGNKQEMLVACIAERAKRLQAPVDLPQPTDRESLARVLTAFGTRLLHEVSDPAVIAVFRLAIAEAARAPEVARTLDSVAREAVRNALLQILTGAGSSGIINGQPAEMVERFTGLLWGSLQVNLLLGVANRPNPREIGRRARDATTAFMQLHPQLTN
jgi:AcrR family transcriptional regulator